MQDGFSILYVNGYDSSNFYPPFVLQNQNNSSEPGDTDGLGACVDLTDIFLNHQLLPFRHRKTGRFLNQSQHDRVSQGLQNFIKPMTIVTTIAIGINITPTCCAPLIAGIEQKHMQNAGHREKHYRNTGSKPKRLCKTAAVGFS